MPPSHIIEPAGAADVPLKRIGILAGGGRLPSLIADSVIAQGGSVHIVGVKGEADQSITAYPHTWVNWGQVGRMFRTLRNEGGGQMVIAGSVTRPILSQLRPDLGFFRVLPQVLRMLVGGDDSVLTRVVRVFELNGVTVRGAHEVAPDLLVPDGALGRVAISDAALADAALAMAVRDALAPLDAGQAVVVADGRVLALEGAEGTDAMLKRVGAQQSRMAGAAPRGILSKGPKPGQELRVDMPVIGARTIDGLAAAGLGGVIAETGRVLLLERAEAIAKADAAGVFIGAVKPQTLPKWVHGPAQPMPRALRPVARRMPNARDMVDIERGLTAVLNLAPLGTGKGAVVSRAYVLGLEAEEGVAAMLARIGALRQWGLGKRRRVGVLVRRLETAEDVPVAAVLREAAAQGLAGVAVMGEAAALARYDAAGKLADELGIFLVVCTASETGEAR